MQGFVYGSNKPYITEDERKISEKDFRLITRHLGKPRLLRHFNFLVNRIFPDKWEMLTKVDQVLLGLLKPAGSVLAGRILFAAPVQK
jgi:hypothetical protein